MIKIYFSSKKESNLLEVVVAPPNKFVVDVVFALPNGCAPKLFCGGEAPPKIDGAALAVALPAMFPPNIF